MCLVFALVGMEGDFRLDLIHPRCRTGPSAAALTSHILKVASLPELQHTAPSRTSVTLWTASLCAEVEPRHTDWKGLKALTLSPCAAAISRRHASASALDPRFVNTRASAREGPLLPVEGSHRNSTPLLDHTDAPPPTCAHTRCWSTAQRDLMGPRRDFCSSLAVNSTCISPLTSMRGEESLSGLRSRIA